MKFGIVILALGHELYGSCAFNLALSLKLAEPKVSIALMTDDKAAAHLTDEEKGFFDHIITIDPKEYTVGREPQYQRAKLALNKYTPFERSIYLDADSIFFDKPISWLAGEIFSFTDICFGLNGEYNIASRTRSSSVYTYWGELPTIAKYHDLKGYIPQTITGFFAWEKNSRTDQLFEIAASVYDDPKAPAIGWAAGRPDEYCFNVALAQMGIRLPVKHVVFFDKINTDEAGRPLPPERIYRSFWGLATGGSKVPPHVVRLYNRLVESYCVKAKIKSPRRFHVDKAEVIPARKGF